MPNEQSLQILLSCLLAMEGDDFSDRLPCFTSCCAASRSEAAFLSHCRTKSRWARSDGFIQDPPVLICRVGNPSNYAFRFFEALSGHHDDVYGVVDCNGSSCSPA